MFDELRYLLRQKRVFTCASCGNTVKIRDLRVFLKGLAHLGNKEVQVLSGKVAHGQATPEELYRHYELIGMKRFLTCKKCGSGDMKITVEW